MSYHYDAAVDWSNSQFEPSRHRRLIVTIPFENHELALAHISNMCELKELVIVVAGHVPDEDDHEQQNINDSLSSLLKVPTVYACKRISVVSEAQFHHENRYYAQNPRAFKRAEKAPAYIDAEPAPSQVQSVLIGVPMAFNALFFDDEHYNVRDPDFWKFRFGQLRQIVAWCDDRDNLSVFVARILRYGLVPYVSFRGPLAPTLPELLMRVTVQLEAPRDDALDSNTYGASAFLTPFEWEDGIDERVAAAALQRPVLNMLQHISEHDVPVMQRVCRYVPASGGTSAMRSEWMLDETESKSPVRRQFIKANDWRRRGLPFQAMCWIAMIAIKAVKRSPIRDSVVAPQILDEIQRLAFDRVPSDSDALHITVRSDIVESVEGPTDKLVFARVYAFLSSRFASSHVKTGYSGALKRKLDRLQ